MKKILHVFIFCAIFINSQSVSSFLEVNCSKPTSSIDLSNDSENDYIFFNNNAYFIYKIYNKNNEVVKRSLFIPYAFDSYYTYINNFSSKQIERTKRKFSIEEEQAVLFLEFKKKSIIIQKNKTTKISQKFLLNSYCDDLHVGEEYYVEGTLYSQIEYFPSQYKDSLMQKKLIILDSIKIPKSRIIVDK